jgi:hypothetical protein
MTKLSPDARTLVDATRSGDDPTSADRSRVRARIAARMVAGTAAGGALATSLASGSAAAAVSAKAPGFLLVVKIIASAALLGGAGAGIYAAAQPDRAPAPPSASVTSAPALHAATGEAAAPETTARPTAADDEPSTQRGTASGHAKAEADPAPSTAPLAVRRAAPPVAPSDDSPPPAPTAEATPAPSTKNSLDAEMALLREAQSALRTGRADAALGLLDQHGKDHADGALREERLAARVMALCKLGRADEARAEAQRFLRAFPRSPLAGRVSGSCAK